MQLSLYFLTHDWLGGMALASARVMPAFILLPFFSNSFLTGAIRMPVAMMVSAALWPYHGEALPDLNGGRWLLVIIRELGIGLLLAIFMMLPFWVLHAAGSMIDNQRGATLSSNMDPVSGVDTSELANLFNLFAAVVVLQGGGLLVLLEVFERSYQLWPPLDSSLPAIKPLLLFIGEVVSNAFILASPLITIFLLTELLLGILSRYAPQLNAFSLALTVKSLIAFTLLTLYLAPVYPGRILSFQLFETNLIKLL